MPERKPPNAKLRFAISLALILAFLALYLTRPDWAQAVHWWPMALLTPIVFAPFLSLQPRKLFKPFGLAALIWLVALHVVREPSAMLFWPHHEKASGDYRVVSLNCAAGEVAAAREAFDQEADIVLLQEVGTQAEFVKAGAEKGYRAVSWSVDDAVFARGEVADPAKEMDFAAGTVRLDGVAIRVVALRLSPPVFRLDLWNPDCWSTYSSDAIKRRERIAQILAPTPAGVPLLMGGDFNATNPTLVTRNRHDLREAGQSAARGWRGTGTNDFPCVWTDQIWASPDIAWQQAYVQKTVNSDHRMVVADFRLKAPLLSLR